MDKQAVLEIMKLVADWQLIHQSPSEPRYKKNDWPWATCYMGFMALSDICDNDNKYGEAMKAMGNSFDWKPAKRIYHADDHAIAQTYLELFLKENGCRKDKMLRPTQEQFDFILANRSKTSLIYPNSRNPSLRYYWCDSLFMGPPTWARLYAATKDIRYLRFIDDEWWATSDFLYDVTEKLWYRDSRYFSTREENGMKVFWSRGNGWVLAGLARTLQYIPQDHPTRHRYEQQFKEMAGKIASLQQPDGLWRASMLDPASYPNKETSGSAFFIFALAWGINSGLLAIDLYKPIVLKGWQALVDCVTVDGKLQYVQPVGTDPRNVSQSDTEVYGTGAFLLAGKEVFICL